MNSQVLDIMRQSAELAEEVQPILDKHAACRSRAVEVADTLVKYQVIPIEKRASVARDLEDPEYAYSFLEKLASSVSISSLGEPTEETGKTSGITPEDKMLNWIIN